MFYCYMRPKVISNKNTNIKNNYTTETKEQSRICYRKLIIINYIFNFGIFSEKSASIHKSKYNTLLKHERTRLNRNEELLQMLEDVQSKAANLASNTERLKMLKVYYIKL